VSRQDEWLGGSCAVSLSRCTDFASSSLAHTD
jgi:hypothetical protein